MNKYLMELILISILLTTLVHVPANSAKLPNPQDYDEEKDSFNELESLKCLPSGFPCTPVHAHSTTSTEAATTSVPEDEEATTTSSSTDFAEDTETGLTDNPSMSATTPFPSKYRNFPSSCCSKCLYEPGWIDAVCA